MCIVGVCLRNLQASPRAHCGCEAHLFQYGVDPVHLAVDHVALLLPPVHLLDDALELGGVCRAANRASGHLPVVRHRRLHDGLQYGETWTKGERERERESDPED